MKAVKKSLIERWVVGLTREFVLRDEVIDRIADAVLALHGRENTTLPFLRKQLADVTKRIDNLLNAIEEGLMNASAQQRLTDLEAKKEDLEISIAKEKIEYAPLTKEQVVFWISRFKDGSIDDPAYRKSIVDIFVNSIFMYDDKLVIAFNWKDGAKTVTFAELESAVKGSRPTARTEKSLDNATFSGSYLVDVRQPKFLG
jgi:hypothetical protein